ncbi:MAG: outer membrane protein transport protein [Muribaculaceae bacterium]
MKKITSIVIALLTVMSAHAEGYQVNTLSARQLGMGHTGTGMKLGAESMQFNPAGMAFMDKTLDLSAGVTGIAPFATCESGGKKFETDNKISTPLYVYAAFSIYDNLKAGVSFTTPYGSSINWTKNWVGANLAQSVSLETYVIQPTVSWKILDNLSIGAGLMIAWGKVDLNKGLVNASSVDMLLAAMHNDYRFGSTTPASVNLTGTAKIAVGFNVGAMYDITKDLTVGVSYRSKMGMKVKAGDAKVDYANKVAEELLQKSLGVINEANFEAEMPMPYTLNFGLSYRPMTKLELAFDAQLTGWSAYKALNVNFLSDKLDAYDQNLVKNYHNSWSFRLGGEYAVTSRFDARLGLNLDLTPVDNKFYNPETPGMSKIAPSLGFSFRPIKSLSIDVACSYVIGLGTDNASYTYEDLIFKSFPNLGQKSEQTFVGNYSCNAWCPSIGLSYSF